MRGLFGHLAGSERKSARSLQEDLWREIFGGNESKTGLSVTTASALEVTAVLRCSIVIADTVGSIPLKLYEKPRGSNAPQEVTDHPLDDIVRSEPNGFQDSLEWRGTMGLHRGLVGQAVNLINRSSSTGEIMELIPAEPGIVSIERGSDLRPRFTVTNFGGKPVQYGPDEVWLWRGPSWDGWRGLNRVRLAREAIGLAMALEQSQARFHKNGARTSGLYSVEGQLNPEQYRDLMKAISEKITGIDNTGNPFILDRGAKFTPTVMTGVDAQQLETRRYQVEEVCRGMSVLPIMAGYSDKVATYASVEQMLVAHAIHTARPLWRSFEKSADRWLLTRDERRAGLYFKFSDAELMRGDAKSRAEYISKMLGSGGTPPWGTQNEARAFDEMPPRPEPWADELPRGTNPAGTKPADQPSTGA